MDAELYTGVMPIYAVISVWGDMKLTLAACGDLTWDPMLAMSNFSKGLILSSELGVCSFWVVALCLYSNWRTLENCFIGIDLNLW